MNIEPVVATIKNPPSGLPVTCGSTDRRASRRRPADDGCHRPLRTRRPHRLALPRPRPVPAGHSGHGAVRTRDGHVVKAHPGQTIYTPPGEEHWHGATPECWMEHLAMLEAGDDPATSTTWLEHVTEQDYAGAMQASGSPEAQSD